MPPDVAGLECVVEVPAVTALLVRQLHERLRALDFLLDAQFFSEQPDQIREEELVLLGLVVHVQFPEHAVPEPQEAVQVLDVFSRECDVVSASVELAQELELGHEPHIVEVDGNARVERVSAEVVQPVAVEPVVVVAYDAVEPVFLQHLVYVRVPRSTFEQKLEFLSTECKVEVFFQTRHDPFQEVERHLLVGKRCDSQGLQNVFETVRKGSVAQVVSQGSQPDFESFASVESARLEKLVRVDLVETDRLRVLSRRMRQRRPSGQPIHVELGLRTGLDLEAHRLLRS